MISEDRKAERNTEDSEVNVSQIAWELAGDQSAFQNVQSKEVADRKPPIRFQIKQTN